MSYILLAIGVVILIAVIVISLKTSKPHIVAEVLRYCFIGLLTAAGLFFLLTGKWRIGGGILVILALLIYPNYQRWRNKKNSADANN